MKFVIIIIIIIITIFALTSVVFHTCMAWTVFLSFARSFLRIFSCISLLIPSFHVFLGCPLRKLPLTLNVLYFSSNFLCRNAILRPNIAQSSNHSYIISLIPRLIISSLTGHVLLPYSATLRTNGEYDLPFAIEVKPLLANKDTKSLNLHIPQLILSITLLNASLLGPTVDNKTKIAKLFHDFRRLVI